MNMDYIGFRIYDDWIRMVRKGHSIKGFLKKNGYETIAIYGMGLIGRQLYEDLNDSEYETVAYCIDKNASQIMINGVEIITVNEVEIQDKAVDAVIVTPVNYFYDIEKELLRYYKGVDILSVRDVIWSNL